MYPNLIVLEQSFHEVRIHGSYVTLVHKCGCQHYSRSRYPLAPDTSDTNTSDPDRPEERIHGNYRAEYEVSIAFQGTVVGLISF